MGVAHYHGYLNSSYSTASVGRKTTVSQKLLLLVTLALSIGCLVWVLQDFEPEKLGGEIRHMHWGWVFAAGGVRHSCLLPAGLALESAIAACCEGARYAGDPGDLCWIVRQRSTAAADRRD